MTHRNENSVLFSLAHLQQLAMVTSGNRQTTFGPARPIYQTQPVEPMPLTFSPTATVLAPRAGWPGALAFVRRAAPSPGRPGRGLRRAARPRCSASPEAISRP